jgi:hypothetical protein
MSMSSFAQTHNHDHDEDGGHADHVKTELMLELHQQKSS